MSMPNPPKTKRRWYQYSLRTLFVLMTLFAIACSWYAVEMQKAAKRRAAIADITRLGGRVYYYDDSDPYTAGKPPEWFSWLRKLYGDEHLGNAVVVEMGGTQVTDADLVDLKGLTNLEWLDLCNTQITDASLVHLEGLIDLDWLGLAEAPITDAGLVHLRELTRLDVLWLGDTQITDAGLVHLRGLTHLTALDIRGTQVTDEGVQNLREALPNCDISYYTLPALE